MKKTIIFGLSALLIGGAFTACKKGENDPFLSLKSRKARLAGEWKLEHKESSSSYSSSNDGYINEQSWSHTYEGETQTTVSSYKYITPMDTTEGSSTTTSKYTMTLKFEKDGTYSTKYFYTASGEIEEERGLWTFVDKNKNADLKKKEAIILTPTGYTESDGFTEDYKGNFPEGSIILIDQLKNKEIILKSDVKETSENGSSNSYKTTMTLKAK